MTPSPDDGLSADEDAGQGSRAVMEADDAVATAVAKLVRQVTNHPWHLRAGPDTRSGATVEFAVGDRQYVLESVDPAPTPAFLASVVVEGAAPLLEAIDDLRARLAASDTAAITDHLTGLLNRWGWDRALVAEDARCERHERFAVVAVVDLDRLKQINDLDGHLGGDLHLLAAATAMRASCRTEDVVARIGGDEFGLIAVEDRPADVTVVARRLREVLSDGGIEASVGAAGRPTVGGLRTAFREADAAMYREKQRRKLKGTAT
jgi:diguanylate cyclase (GGDEF)-like protein